VALHHVRETLPSEFEERSIIGEAERSLLIGSRLLSPNHVLDNATRSVFVSRDRSASVMANEEDHIRAQSVFGGLAFGSAGARTQALVDRMEELLPTSNALGLGYLTAWPGNAGRGVRIGAMLHLGAMALKRKKPVVPEGFAIRGLLGEGSRGFGGFVQVSTTQRGLEDLLDYVGVLVETERSARQELERCEIDEADVALTELDDDREFSLDKAVDLVSRLRLRAAIDASVDRTARDYDALLAVLDLRSQEGASTSLKRRSLIRRFVEFSLPWHNS
jgi:protein-arginine kinase